MSDFVPREYKNIPITVRIHERKLNIINANVAKLSISRNDFINQCIDYALENMKLEDYDRSNKNDK
jgi:hypothetical protein